MVWVEERLPGCVGACAKIGVRVFPRFGVLAVVDEENSLLGQDRWRAYFRESAIEMAGAIMKHDRGLAGRSLYRGPVDQVIRTRNADLDFSPVHPESAVDFGGNQAAVVEAGDNAAGLVHQAGVGAGGSEGGAVLGPMDEVGGGGDADGVGLAVPLGVGEDVCAVGSF